MAKHPRRIIRPAKFSRRPQHQDYSEVAKVLKDDQVDIDALHSALLSFTLLSGKLRSARTKRPISEWTRGDFGQFLNELDRDLRVAIAMLAGELGFAVCRCCWPPEVLAIDLKGQVTPLAETNGPGEIQDSIFAKDARPKIRSSNVVA